ncbi:hypothetical protein HYV86_07615 [Candidatus Woesearchaeota archaeon]|nr:hypothetical protein [Candidatus Woesearchaeota archaeon]
MDQYQRSGETFQLVGYAVHAPLDSDASPADSAEIVSAVRAILGDETFRRVRAGFRTNSDGIDIHRVSAPDAENSVFALYATAQQMKSAINLLRSFDNDDYLRFVVQPDGSIQGPRLHRDLVTSYLAQPISYLLPAQTTSLVTQSTSSSSAVPSLETVVEAAPPKITLSKPVLEDESPQKLVLLNHGNVRHLARAFNEALQAAGYKSRGTLEYHDGHVRVVAIPDGLQLSVEVYGLGETSLHDVVIPHLETHFAPFGDGAQYALRRSVQDRYATNSRDKSIDVLFQAPEIRRTRPRL